MDVGLHVPRHDETELIVGGAVGAVHAHGGAPRKKERGAERERKKQTKGSHDGLRIGIAVIIGAFSALSPQRTAGTRKKGRKKVPSSGPGRRGPTLTLGRPLFGAVVRQPSPSKRIRNRLIFITRRRSLTGRRPEVTNFRASRLPQRRTVEVWSTSDGR